MFYVTGHDSILKKAERKANKDQVPSHLSDPIPDTEF